MVGWLIELLLGRIIEISISTGPSYHIREYLQDYEI